MVQANAGLPNIVDGEAIYDVDAKEFLKGLKSSLKLVLL